MYTPEPLAVIKYLFHKNLKKLYFWNQKRLKPFVRKDKKLQIFLFNFITFNSSFNKNRISPHFQASQ